MAREYSNELRASIKVPKCPIISLEPFAGSNQTANVDTSAVSEAYSNMLTAFIPLLVDESSFFSHFMCFEVPPLSGDIDLKDDKPSQMHSEGKHAAELGALNEYLQALLDGIQEDFYALVDWAYKYDPLRCISMHGITERYLSGQKADTAGFVRLLLDDIETRISLQFSKFVDEACHQIERNERNVRQVGVLSYIPRFATVATRMEQYIQGHSRDLVDQAYTKIIPFQVGLSKADLRKMLKYSLSGVDKTIYAMYKKLQKNLTSEELLPSLWEKCKKDFLDKYESFLKLIAKIYPNEQIPSMVEMRELLGSM